MFIAKIAQTNSEHFSCKLQAASCKLQAASCKLQAASCKLQAASCKLQAASCKLQAATLLSHICLKRDPIYLFKCPPLLGRQNAYRRK
jgi:hypothetical protein